MPIKDKALWEKWIKNNQDEYGKCIIDLSREVMQLLDNIEEFDSEDLILKADRDMKAGITGFMTGAIANVVVSCHSRGEEFRKSWNHKIGSATGQQDSKGVLNPAVLNIRPK